MQIQGPRNRFLARPFWRDYVVAYVMIGFGFTLNDIGVTQPDRFDRLMVEIPAITIFVAGVVVLVCAIGWSLQATWRSRRS